MKKKCEHCEKGFKAKSAKAKYCSSKCRKAAFDKRKSHEYESLRNVPVTIENDSTDLARIAAALETLVALVQNGSSLPSAFKAPSIMPNKSFVVDDQHASESHERPNFDDFEMPLIEVKKSDNPTQLENPNANFIKSMGLIN